MIPEPTQAEVDEVLGAAVALMRAAQDDDVGGATLIVDSVDLRNLVGLLAGLCNWLAIVAYGADEWRAALVRWQPGQQLGDPPPE